MRFSILIPVYNTGAYLKECMDSLLGQSFQDFEVILVDDGSTDGTEILCDGYASERVRIIHKKNAGLLLARRTAVPLARGEFCLFLDSDDTLRLDALEKIDGKLRKTGADILVYNTALVYQNDFENAKPRQPVFPEDRVFTGEEEKRPLYEKLLKGFQLNNLVLKAIRTPLVQEDDTDYEAIGDNSMGEDLLQSLYPMTHAGCIAYTPECYYYYRQSDSGMTRQVDPARLERRLKAYNPHVLPMRKAYAEKWSMWDEATMYAVYAGVLRQLRLIFTSTFRACPDEKTRKQWCAYSWETMLPEEVMARWKDKKMGLGKFARLQLEAIFSHRYWQVKALAAVQQLGKGR